MNADFEPPKYIQSLIGAINDAAKAAQTFALFLLAVGLYLVATVISTTDEDLLRGTAMQVSQLGVRTPVAIAYALAPTIFLFLHVHTLIRFDMLAANLRLLAAELARAVRLTADRERCRALLANVEFVQYLAAPPGSPFRSPLFRFMAWLIISALPVAVFLAVQISFLRYQSEAITTLHQACLALDLAALSWLHMRLWLAGRKRRVIPAAAFWSRMALNRALPLLVIAFALIYAGVPSAERMTVGADPVRAAREDVTKAVTEDYERGGMTTAAWATATGRAAWAAIGRAASQPLDLAACPWLGFGCRYLRLDHRTLLAGAPPADVLARLRTGTSRDLDKDLAHVEGLFLRGRMLRFADFTESRLYVADLAEADLRGAVLRKTQVQGARLGKAQLQAADLWQAQLQGAVLGETQLQGAKLVEAKYGAHLGGAELEGPWLVGAELQGADLRGAELQGADLRGAKLQGADLRGAQLQGAHVRWAPLQGADLRGAQLQGADLRETRLWQTAFDAWTNFGLVDLRAASWQPIDENESPRIREIINAFPVGEDWQRDRKARLEGLIAPGEQSDHPPDFALEGVLLVVDVDDPRWQRLDRTQLTTDDRVYDEALVPLLADLAASYAHVARRLAWRVEELAIRIEGEERSRAARLARGPLDRAGPALPEDVRERLSRIASQPMVED